MNVLLKQHIIPFVLGTVFVTTPLYVEARSIANHHTAKNFRALIVRGERPEIAACMVAALSVVREDTKFDSIRWDVADSDGANVQEFEKNGQLIRTIRFKSYLRQRQQAIFSDPWQRAEVSCEQRDEHSPEVRFLALP
jgi:hypothetical protein